MVDMMQPSDLAAFTERFVTLSLKRLRESEWAVAQQLCQRYLDWLMWQAHGKLEGYTNAELAQKLSLSRRRAEAVPVAACGWKRVSHERRVPARSRIAASGRRTRD